MGIQGGCELRIEVILKIPKNWVWSQDGYELRISSCENAKNRGPV